MNNVMIMESIKAMAEQIGAMGSQLEITDIERQTGIQISESKKEQYIDKHSENWIQIGASYRSWRIENEFSKSYVAGKIGCASSTLSRWEDGEPCRIAKNIQAGYELLKELQELKAS